MKNIQNESLTFIMAIICVSCFTTPQKSQNQTGVATEALKLEEIRKNTSKAQAWLTELVGLVKKNIEQSGVPIHSERTLEIIHNTILYCGFTIPTNNSVNRTFAASLTDKVFDCSDLTLVYLEIFAALDTSIAHVLAKNHVLIALPTERGYIYWDATTGETVDIGILAEEAYILPESITSGTYLTALPPEKILCAVYYEMAIDVLGETEDWKEAERLFRESLRVHREFAHGYHGLAIVLGAQERYEEGIPIILEALRLDPTSPQFYDCAISLYMSEGDIKHATALCQRALDNEAASDFTLEFAENQILTLMQEITEGQETPAR